MRDKKQKLPLMRLERLEITDMADEGRALGRAGDKVCFVEGAVPGDVVDVEVYRNKHRYMYARVVHVHAASASRTTPKCTHFGLCGGCKWQHLDYQAQLFWKGKQVHDALVRLGKVEVAEVQHALPAPEPYAYRNKLEFTATGQRWLTVEEMSKQGTDVEEVFEGVDAVTDVVTDAVTDVVTDAVTDVATDVATKGEAPTTNSGEKYRQAGLGFHLPGRFDKVMHVQECHLMDQKANDLRNFIHQYAEEHGWTRYNQRSHEGFLRTLTLRNSSLGQWMVLVMVSDDKHEAIAGLMSALANSFPWITSLQYVVNPKKNDTLQGLHPQVWAGPAYIEERLGDLKFHISPESFFQTNSRQAQRLYDLVAEWAAPTPTDGVYDLYSGTGTIGLFMARKAAWVVGLEYTEAAVEDARRNAARNGIHNAQFVAGDLKNLLTEDFIGQFGRPSVLITDPPRSGMHPDVVAMLCRMRVPRLVYVSCNPATQARDLDLMRDTYRVERYQPVDMFPQTHHVENVVLLTSHEH
jgi:23S rRNA (uracil1939-C5)-methyltransferase